MTEISAALASGLSSASGDAQAIIDAVTEGLKASPLSADGRFFVAGKSLKVIDLEDHLDAHRDRPRRKVGTYAVHDGESFVAYLAKHGLDRETEVWADVVKARIVGVINGHLGTTGDGLHASAGWADHRVTYDVQYTDAWKAWAAHDGKLLDQSTFAEHLEDRAIDIIRPTAAEMLELAQTFQATIGVKFESSKLLSSGERQLEYREQVDAKAGRAGQLEVPKDFELALTPFEGASPYRVVARFRYRIQDGVLRVGYRLERPADMLRDAFLGVVDKIEEGIEAPVFRGVSA